jgi:hypothetical protein
MEEERVEEERRLELGVANLYRALLSENYGYSRKLNECPNFPLLFRFPSPV